ncbi:MAG: DcrB-related protein [Planctomycetes bacterium]|nr:DcrB-related protein [Planctomycetota bacterium]
MQVRVSIMLAALALAGCSAGLPPDVAELGYVNRDQRFALNVPAAWAVREMTGTTPVILSGPESAGAGRPNINVTVVPSCDGVTLEYLVQTSRKGLARLPGFRLETEGETAAGSHRAWTATFEESSSGRTVRQRQLYVVAGGRGYIATAASLPEGFAAQEPNFDACFRSFRAGW